MTTTAYARFSPRRGGWRLTSWWARALVRAIDEAAYDEAQAAASRALARSGRVGGLILSPGTVVASVEDPNAVASTGESGLFSVRIDVPVLDEEGAAALAEVLGSRPRDADALSEGELPHDLVEHLEEMGVELLPYAEEITAACSCRTWQQVCVHALGVLQQLAWLVDAGPIVLLRLRGADLPQRHTAPTAETTTSSDVAEPEEVDPVDIAYDAALRARALLGGEPETP